LESVWEMLSHANRYLNESAPWALTENIEHRPRLATILYTSAEVIRIATVLLAPVLPISCAKVWEQLGMNTALKTQRIDGIKWGGLPVGCSLGQIKPIFPRLDKKAILEKIFPETEIDQESPSTEKRNTPSEPATAKNHSSSTEVIAPKRAAEKPANDKITIEDFSKVELRVAQVVSAEPVPGADKLLKLVVDLGDEKRQILAGIAKAYPAETLVGRKIVVVANLQPRKMRGLESNGMLLAASIGEDGRPVLAGFLEDVPNGAKLK